MCVRVRAITDNRSSLADYGALELIRFSLHSVLTFDLQRYFSILDLFAEDGGSAQGLCVPGHTV